MEAKTFSRNSLVYRFLAWPGDDMWFDWPRDICHLRRNVIGKILVLLLMVSGTLLYGYCVSSFILYKLGQWFGGVFSAYVVRNVPVALGSAFTLITFAAGLLLGTVCLLVYIQKYFQRRKWERDGLPPKPNGPIKEMYLSWKNKLCYKIDFQ
jgi:hypothetical protein